MTEKKKAKAPEDKNLELWNAVCETDPSVTSIVEKRGGFTAICAQHQIKRASALWGPYGKEWGVKDIVWQYINDAAGKPVELTLDAVFFCPATSFLLGSDMAYQPGNDSKKKLLTDLTTKALSKLGFNSDVFEGKFDDNKYVETMKEKFGNGGDEKTEKKEPPQEEKKAASNSELKAAFVHVKAQFDRGVALASEEYASGLLEEASTYERDGEVVRAGSSTLEMFKAALKNGSVPPKAAWAIGFTMKKKMDAVEGPTPDDDNIPF